VVIVLTSPFIRARAIGAGRRGTGVGLNVALEAAAAGARVELVGKVGDDDAGNGIAVELERAGVGHAALLRDPSSTTPVEGGGAPLSLGRADVELALRYLVDFRVVVAADRLAADASAVVAEAAHYVGAHRIILAEGDVAANLEGADQGSAPRDPVRAGDAGDVDPLREQDVTVLLAPIGEAGAFTAFVGRYAALLDAGRAPSDAFADAAREIGWEPARHA